MTWRLSIIGEFIIFFIDDSRVSRSIRSATNNGGGSGCRCLVPSACLTMRDDGRLFQQRIKARLILAKRHVEMKTLMSRYVITFDEYVGLCRRVYSLCDACADCV